MPAARSQSSVNFRAIKKSAAISTKKPKSPKKGKKAQAAEPSAELPALSSDAESVSEDDTFEPLKESEAKGRKLDENRYLPYHRSLKKKRGTVRPIHTEGQTKVHEILRIFDLSYEYGPALGVNRLERWERAQKAGLNPPVQVKEILLTEEGQKRVDLAENVFHDEGV